MPEENNIKNIVQQVLRNFIIVRLLPATLFMLLPVMVYAQDSIPASFMRERYHSSDFVHYIEALNDYVVYQGNHSGQWSDADRLLFSINGNPYHMNRFYIDGIRVDDRYNPGSTHFIPNVEHYDVRMNTTNSSVDFLHDKLSPDYISFQGNVGNIGGISSGSSSIIHIFHRAGWEGAYKPEVTIPNRPHVRHSFKLETSFSSTRKNGIQGSHFVSATYGSRALARYDADGLIDSQPLYNSPYYKLQTINTWKGLRQLDEIGFFANISGKDDRNSELYYNWQEVSSETVLSATVFGKKNINGHSFCSSLTYSLNAVRHDNLCFRRNVIDQDGESFEPWESDGQTHEFTWFLAYKRKLGKHFRLFAEAYNTFFLFFPSQGSFSNDVYCKLPDPIESHFQEGEFVPIVHEAIPLLHYDWHSYSFASGLLENKAGIGYSQHFGRCLSFEALLSATVDGFVLRGGNGKISPNLAANARLIYSPSPHFLTSATLAHDRISYDIDHIRFFSHDYLSGEAVGAKSNQLMLTTGGKYREMKSDLRQTSFFSLDLPVYIRLGKRCNHEIALIQTYRKYYNTWHTAFAGETSQYGHYENGIFFYDYGKKRYTVGYMPDGVMGNSFFTSTPYYLSQTTRYTYSGKKFYFSASWQSMQFGSTSALGNGPVSNNVGALSESTANPNTSKVTDNDSRYSAAGRADQDKAYVFRIYAAYNVSKLLQVGVNMKWTDGQPFSNFNTIESAGGGVDRQIAIVPARSRGTNPIDGNFGSRENALFNIDLHARLNWSFRGHDMSLSMMCYNIFDFGNSINEYCFNDGLNDNRADMLLNIPRGLILKYQINL